MAANIFTGATNNNWGTATNWSLGTVPTATDTHTATFNILSPNCTVNVSAVCNAIDFTGYTNTITMTNSITVSGNVTFDATMSSRVSGSGELVINASCVFTGNGGTWNNNITFAGVGATTTLTSNLNVSGQVITSQTTIINGAFNINTGGFNSALGVSGTATIVFNGTGTWTGINAISNPIQINTAGTLTLSGNVNITNTTVTYISGTTITTGSDFRFGSNVTLNVNGDTSSSATTTSSTGINFNTLTVTSNAVFTVSSPIRVIGTFTARGAFNGSTIYCSSDISVTNVCSGTSSIVLDGTGTWSGTGTIQKSLTINTVGTITLGTTINYNTGTLTYTAGTVITTGSTLYIAASTTLNTSGIIWENIQSTSATQTWTLLSDLNITGTLTTANIVYTVTINGAFYINLSGSFQEQNGGIINGTCLGIKMIGTGIWNQSGTPTISIPVIFNTTGEITVSQFSITSTSFTILAGTVIWAPNYMNFSGTCTINITKPAEYYIPYLTITAASTITLSSNLYAGYVGLGTTGNPTINGNNLYIDKEMQLLNNITVAGTTNIHLIGGIVSWFANATGVLNNNLYINCGTLYIGTREGKFILNVTGLTVYYGTGILRFIKGKVIMPSNCILNIQTNCTLNDIHKANFSNVLVTASRVLTMNEFFCGSPDNKTKVRSTALNNYTVTFSDKAPKKAFHVNVKNCTVTQTTTKNQLNIINRDGNSGLNTGIIFGESGMGGFSLGQFPIQNTYDMSNGFLTNMSY